MHYEYLLSLPGIIVFAFWLLRGKPATVAIAAPTPPPTSVSTLIPTGLLTNIVRGNPSRKWMPLNPDSISGRVIRIVQAHNGQSREVILPFVQQEFQCTRAVAIEKLNAARERDRILWFPETDSYRVGRGFASLSTEVEIPPGAYRSRKAFLTSEADKLTMPKPSPEQKPSVVILPSPRRMLHQTIVEKIASIVEDDPGIRRPDLLLMCINKIGQNKDTAQASISNAVRLGKILYNKESNRFYAVNPQP